MYKKIIKILISVVFLFTVLKSIDISELLFNIKAVNIYYLLFTLVLTILGVVISSARLLLLKKIESFFEVIKINFIGILFNMILPGVTGGDIYRVGKINLSQHSLKKSAVLVFMDRLIGFSGVVICFFIGLLAFKLQGNEFPFIALLSSQLNFEFLLEKILPAALVVFGLIILFLEKNKIVAQSIYKQMKMILIEISEYLKNSTRIYYSIILSVIFQLLSSLMFFILLKAIDRQLDIQLVDTLIVVPIVTVATMVPISVQGIGVREYLYIMLLPAVKSEVLVSASVLSYFVYIICAAIGAYCYLTEKRVNDK